MFNTLKYLVATMAFLVAGSSYGQGLNTTPPLAFLEFTTGQSEDGVYPVMIAIHGLGDRPENFSQLYRRASISARWIIPRAPTAHGRGYSWFPVAIPLRRHDPGLETGIRSAAKRVVDLIRWLRIQRPNMAKPVVTGFSQGGMISFMLAAEYGDVIGGAVPVAGALPPKVIPQKRAKVQVVALHGTDDRIVDYFSALRTTKRFRDAGIPISIHPFAGVGHQISTEMRQLMFEVLARLSKPIPARAAHALPAGK